MKKIFLLALIIRLICLYVFRNVNNYDLQSYLQVGELTLNKINIYPDIANLHHPYLPFFLYLEAFAFYLKKFTINPITVIKFIIAIFDLGNLYLVYLLSKKNLEAPTNLRAGNLFSRSVKSENLAEAKKTVFHPSNLHYGGISRRRVKTAFLYAVNPVTILITTLHGQFDAIPLFFLLWSLYLISFSRHSRVPSCHPREGGDPVLSMLMFSAAVMIKTWPVLLILLFLKRLKNKKLIFLSLIFPILSIIIYVLLFNSSFISILKTIGSYQGLYGIWGAGKIFSFITKRILFQKLLVLFFLFCLMFYSILIKSRSIIKEILLFLLFFFIFTPNFSIQYFAWIIPFLIIAKPKKYLLLILFITLTLISYYATPNLIIIQEITQFITWILFIYSLKVNELTEVRD